MGEAWTEKEQQFLINGEKLREIAASFRQAMEYGLRGAPSSLKMLPSYLSVPGKGLEGRFAAVDFGGSHIRALEVELANGQANILSYRKMRVPAARDGEELFGAIAELVGAAVLSAEYLGHTFSFPCRQHGVNQAELIAWTKELAIPGVVGRDVNALLGQALAAKGLRVKPAAILNDTVGTLLTGAYAEAGTDIASICGTGHNTCYIEPVSPIDGKPMIINMEAGNFNDLPFSRFDDRLDAASEVPGGQRLEKMVAGRYLGELARLVIAEIDPAAADFLQTPYSLTAQDLAEWLEPASWQSWLAGRGLPAWSEERRRAFGALVGALFKRSAGLAAATFCGVLQHFDPALGQRHVIAVDGSLYEKTPGYAAQMRQTLGDLLGKAASCVEIRLVKDGSGIGAAIAAAIASEEKGR